MFDNILKNQTVLKVAKAFSKPDDELSLVGGAVRDLLRGASAADLDFATNLPPDEIQKRLSPLGALWLSGSHFGTIGVSVGGEKVEVTSYRSELYDPSSRKPTITFGNSLEADLLRRDLTMNAIALKLRLVGDQLTGVIFDPFGGAEDLRNGILRTPSDPMVTLSEDPLRIMRAIRFSVLRNMQLSEGLCAAIKDNAPRLAIVAQERKLMETEKILNSSMNASQAFRMFEELGVTEHVFGVMNVDPEHLSNVSDNRLSILSFLALASPLKAALLQKLRFPLADYQAVKNVLNLVDMMSKGFSEMDLRRAFRKNIPESFSAALDVMNAMGFDISPTREKLALLVSSSLRDPLPVNGDDALALGLKGKEIGSALARVESALISKLEISRTEALEILKK